jgi:hypothetical protein
VERLDITIAGAARPANPVAAMLDCDACGCRAYDDAATRECGATREYGAQLPPGKSAQQHRSAISVSVDRFIKGHPATQHGPCAEASRLWRAPIAMYDDEDLATRASIWLGLQLSLDLGRQCMSR